MAASGRIFSIEEFATFDGPGIRMTVFLKGCPLRCTWCHNPEGQSLAAEYVRSPNGCLGCGACYRASDELADGTRRLSERSAAACPRSLVRLCGEDCTVEELCSRLLANASILRASGGGVTFSGGEPLMQADFLCSMLDALDGKLHRAIQTCGFARAEVFERVLSKCDYVLYDLKLMDVSAHKLHCGTDNAPIIENYRTLARSDVPFVTRVPLIPTVTDTEENLSAIARFISGLGVRYVELLPYNKLAGSKYSGLLREYSPSFDGTIPPNIDTEVFARYGIKAKIM